MELRRRKLCRNSRSSNGRYGIGAANYTSETAAIEAIEQNLRRLAKSRISAVCMISDCVGDDNWQLDVGGGEEGRCLAFKRGIKGVEGIGLVSYLIVAIKNTEKQHKLTFYACAAISTPNQMEQRHGTHTGVI